MLWHVLAADNKPKPAQHTPQSCQISSSTAFVPCSVYPWQGRPAGLPLLLLHGVRVQGLWWLMLLQRPLGFGDCRFDLSLSGSAALWWRTAYLEEDQADRWPAVAQEQCDCVWATLHWLYGSRQTKKSQSQYFWDFTLISHYHLIENMSTNYECGFTKCVWPDDQCEDNMFWVAVFI